MTEETKKCKCTNWDGMNLPDGHRPNCKSLKEDSPKQGWEDILCGFVGRGEHHD